MRHITAQFTFSKKAIAMIVGLVVGPIVGFGDELGLDLDPAELTAVLSTLLVYILGQGVADAGKEQAKIQSGSS